MQVPTAQQLPVQETGIRYSRALPYILHCSAKVLVEQNQIQLLFSNTGKQGAVFHVYNKLDLNATPKRYMLEAGKHLEDVWTLTEGEYDLWVLGPNGFHRAFKGDLNDPMQLESLAEIRVCVEECQPKLYLKLRHDGIKPCNLELKANAYLNGQSWQMSTQATEQDLILDMSDVYGWYDFTVYIHGQHSFERRLAGRIETGQDSYSDPFMGSITA